MTQKLSRLSIAFSLLVLALTQSACQSSAKKDFERIQTGMEKVEVLDIMGDPQRKRRSQSVDHWTYVFYDEKKRVEKEVQFADGVATYVGDVKVPTVSAEEQDRLYEASNREVERRYQERREEAISNLPRYEEEMRSSPGAGRGESEGGTVPSYQPVD